MNKVERPKTRLSSVTTAVRLLKAFSDKDVEIGISALSKRLEVSKSTVHRLAKTLVAEGLLEQNKENERYRLGITLFALGALVRRRMDLSNEAKPLLGELRRVTEENVHLAILQGHNVTFIYDLESPHRVRLSSQLGSLKPAFCSAEGLAILAFLPNETVEEILSGNLTPKTGRTITNPSQIRERLSMIRHEGYAIESEETDIGTRCAAAPVFDADRSVIAAIGVAGPSQRLSRKAISSFLPNLMGAAEMISARIGYRPPSRSVA